MESLHPLYAYDDHSVYVVSSQYEDVRGLKLTSKIYNLDCQREVLSRRLPWTLPADSTNKVFDPSGVQGPERNLFPGAAPEDASGKEVGSNFYWLSTKTETLDWEKSNWYTTPTSSFADYTSLSQLPKVT